MRPSRSTSSPACAPRIRNARLLAGSTDVGLWVTKQFRDLGDILYIGNVAELKTIERDAQTLTIGAAVIARRRVRGARRRLPRTRRTVDALRVAADPQRRHARRQRRERLADRRFDAGADRARRAKSCCATARKTRTLPLDAFYLGYQKTALAAGEFVAALRVPRPARDLRFRTYKSVEALRSGHLGGVRGVRAARSTRTARSASARIAFGGMAATPKRAAQAEAALIGATGTKATARASDERARRRLPAAHRHARLERLPTARWRATCCGASTSKRATMRRSPSST